MTHPQRRRYLGLAVLGAAALAAGAAASVAAGKTSTHAIKIGLLSTCKGPFAPFYPETMAGAKLPLLERGGKLDGKEATSGVSGVSIGGHTIKLVFGCSDASPDKAVAEARRLVEQEKVDILLGPLSGDEGIAIHNYAHKQPGVTFVNGTSAAQDTTLKNPAPNFFRFTTDGAQWMAGLGAYAYKTLGWRKVVTIGDDYSFPYTQEAGFVAEFCAVGGEVVKRIWPPLGTQDFTSYVAQIPRSGIDGFFMTVGGTGTVAFAKAYTGLGGQLAKKMIGGSVTIDPTALDALGDRLVGVVSGAPIPPDSKTALWKKYQQGIEKNFPGVSAASLFTAGYYDEMTGLLKGLEAVNGDLSGGHKKFNAALAKVEWDSPHGHIKLDKNRNAIADNFVIQVVKGKDGKLGYKTLKVARNVDQTFGGHFSEKTSSPSRESPPCKKGGVPPWAK